MMSNERADYESIQRRVDRKLKHERIWFLHVLIFLAYLAVCTTGTIPISGVILIGWATLLFIHQTWVNSIGKREAALEREVKREQELSGYMQEQKPKRDGEVYALGDDGELIDISDDYADEKQKRYETGA